LSLFNKDWIRVMLYLNVDEVKWVNKKITIQ